MFDELLDANRRYAEGFGLGELTSTPTKGLTVLTCVDTRIDPLSILGLRPGEAKVLRNAGARVTEDALRSLVLVTNLLGVRRIVVLPHTDCAVHAPADDLGHRVEEAAGQDLGDMDLRAVEDLETTLAADVQAIRDHPLIPEDVAVVGWCYDVATGLVRPVVD